MATKYELTGRVFGKLTVTGFAGSTNKKWYWWCRCECGVVGRWQTSVLLKGHTKSCGCQRYVWGNRQQHRLSKSPHYRVWTGMIARCHHPHSSAYKWYGGRGIVVCDRWRNSVEAFIEDMGDRPAGSQIDRIDNDRGYEPGNCRWATPKQNSRNKSNHAIIAHDGRTLLLAEWAELTGISRITIGRRLKAGWTVADSLTVRPAFRADTERRRLDRIRHAKPAIAAGGEKSKNTS